MVALRVKIAAWFQRTKASTAIFQTISRKMTGTYEVCFQQQTPELKMLILLNKIVAYQVAIQMWPPYK